ncbi:MAG: MFS transporter, partial [Simkaniaceae bacterium]|nr:MFS transporter [Simkaniaceae bacterium]
MATGLLNIFFGLSSSLMVFCLFWGLNGLFQGWGWPPCARLLTHWYARSERGGWWGIWNTSHNVGGGLSILMGPLIATLFGWRMAMYVPGVICLLGGVYLAITLRDTPQSLGLPPIEEHKNEAVSGSEEDRERELSTKEILFKYVLANKFLWILAFGYFFIYAIRTAINDWGQLYLMEQKGHSLISAGGAIFWFEIGGLFGSVIAGLISDRLFASRRGPVNVLFSLFVTFALGLLWIIPNSNYLVASVSIFFIGFLIFGPQMLIGMAAAELSHKKAAGTATGFAGWFGYFGAAFSAYPFGVIATKWGWGGFFLVLGACACISVLILLPLWSVRSRDEIISTEGKVA